MNTDLVLTAQWQKNSRRAEISGSQSDGSKKPYHVKGFTGAGKSREGEWCSFLSDLPQKGSSTKLLGETKTGIFYDDNPVTGKVSYLARADSGKTVSGFRGIQKHYSAKNYVENSSEGTEREKRASA